MLRLETSNSAHTKHDLPSWIFDIDDFDEDIVPQQKSLLEELEIDPHHIYRYHLCPKCIIFNTVVHRNIMWMLISPCNRILGRPYYKRHPLYASTTNKQAVDFWGPCGMVSLLILILWIGRVKDVPWIYVIWSVAAIFNHFVTRPWYPSSLLTHVALLGYSIVPLIPFAAIILIMKPPVLIKTILEVFGIIWGSSAAILSYLTVIVTTSFEAKSKMTLLYPMVVLMQLYLVSLLP